MESSIPLGTNSKPTHSQKVMGSTIRLVILTDGMVSGDSRLRKFDCFEQETLVIYFGSLDQETLVIYFDSLEEFGGLIKSM